MISSRLARLTLVCLALFLITSAFASAQQPIQPDWRLYIATDDGNGMYGFQYATVGVNSAATDGYGADGTASDTGSGLDMRYAAMQPVTKVAVPTFGGHVWSKDLKSPRSPMDPQYDVYGHRKVWFMRAAGMGSAYTNTPIRLCFKHVAVAAGLPPLTLPYVTGGGQTIQAPVKYCMKMTDNKGVAGAPANGTIWDIPMPAVFTSSYFFSLTLPTINISADMDEQAFLNEGYQLEFYQQIVPEPGSLMALACGVMGLGGMFIRRKK